MRRQGKNNRTASITLEVLCLLPVLLCALLWMCLCLSIEKCEQQLIHASAQGCRVLAQGGCIDDVKIAVGRCLRWRSLGSCVKIEFDCDDDTDDDDMDDDDTDDDDDMDDCDDTCDYVMVRVWVPAKKVFPVYLRCFGCALTDEKLIGQTVMRKE